MKKQIVSILLAMLLFATLSSVAGTINKNDRDIINTSQRTDIDWWPMFQHDPQNTGFTTSDAPDTNFTLWKNIIEEPYKKWAYPMVYNDKLYVASGDYFTCFNTDTGEEIWVNESFTSATGVAIVDDKIYTGVGSGLYCIDANNGTLLWSTYIYGTWTYGTPTVVGGKVYMGAWGNNNVYCFDANNGEIIWAFETEGRVLAAPAVFDSRVYIGSQDGKLYCLDANGNGDGTTTEYWNNSVGDLYQKSVSVINNKVYVGSPDTFYCLDALDDGNILWTKPIGSYALSCPVIAYGNVYINSDHHTIYCYDAETGADIWEYSIINTSVCWTSVADEKIYFGGIYSPGPIGTMFCLDAIGNGDGTTDMIWFYEISGTTQSSISPPAIADGKVFVAFYEELLCFRDNSPPEIPETPIGPIEGEVDIEYSYFTSTYDIDEDGLYLKFDFGDEETNWLGPYYPYDFIPLINHSWSEAGIYQVRAKAKDIYDAESDWSDSLEVIIYGPELEIGEITGGLLSINTELINSGVVDITDIEWSIQVNGGLLGLINKNAEGSIDVLQSGSSEDISISPILGFGPIEVSITANAEGIDEIVKTAEGFVFFVFVIIQE